MSGKQCRLWSTTTDLFFRIQRVSTVIWSNRTHSEITLDPPLNSPIRCFCLLTESSATLHRICERTAKAMLIQIGFASGMQRQIWTLWKSPFYHDNGQMKYCNLMRLYISCFRIFRHVLELFAPFAPPFPLASKIASTPIFWDIVGIMLIVSTRITLHCAL